MGDFLMKTFIGALFFNAFLQIVFALGIVSSMEFARLDMGISDMIAVLTVIMFVAIVLSQSISDCNELPVPKRRYRSYKRGYARSRGSRRGRK